MPQPLSSKENALFRQVIRNYEEKQYRRALKAAEQILKKNGKHGDTMAMKALIINQQGKTDEAFGLGKEALMADMKSHICWHVYGLLYRHQKNFEEAIKAYKTALKLDPESVQIQRDLAFLQVQMRDYAGYIQSRAAMLQARSQLRQNWTALAIAHHLNGDLEQAERVLTMYEESLKTPPSRTDYENSEAVMYKNSIIAERGDYQRALEHLDSAAVHSLDRLAVLELKAEYLVKLGRREEAAKQYRVLLERNAEHPDYYDKLSDLLDIAEDDQTGRKAMFDEYAAKNPRCDAAKRLPLDFLTGDAFRDAARSYLSLMLNKGVPSTFVNLKHLYIDAEKRDILGQLAQEYLDEKREEKRATTDDTAKETIDGEAPRGEGAALYYLAQHYNYHVSRDLSKAISFVDEGLALVPQNVEFHMTKARVLKHQGALTQACETMDEARKLDLRDRYINTKAAKYQLRNDEPARAMETMGLFTRNDSPGGPLADMLEMQCIWFLTEDGEAYARKGNVGLALKRFHAVHDIFDTWHDDQFDFHSFSLRKGQIRAYVDAIRWEHHLRDHPFYARAALDTIALYIKMHDGALQLSNGSDSATTNGHDALERKKAAKKARKAERDAAEKAAKQDPNKGTKVNAAGEEVGKKVDEDPNGLELARTKDPLAAAGKFLEHLLRDCEKDVKVWLVGFELYLRREKYLLALRCLNKATSLSPSHPCVHEQTIRLRHSLSSPSKPVDPKVRAILDTEFSALSNLTSISDLLKHNAEFLGKHTDSPEHVVAAARTKMALGGDVKECEKDLRLVLAIEGAAWQDGRMVVDEARTWVGADVDGLRKEARERWPGVSVF